MGELFYSSFRLHGGKNNLVHYRNECVTVATDKQTKTAENRDVGGTKRQKIQACIPVAGCFFFL